MSDVKVKVYTPGGQYVGYFLNPSIEQFPEGEYEVSGKFFDDAGVAIIKLDFNPQSVPYAADMSELSGVPHKRLTNVYVQRGRQPVRMSGLGSSN